MKKNIRKLFMQNHKGFTLIELLVLIAIFAILVAIIVLLSAATLSAARRSALEKQQIEQSNVRTFEIVFSDGNKVTIEAEEQAVYATSDKFYAGTSTFNIDDVKFCFKIPKNVHTHGNRADATREIVYARP
jgi:prepilin-type N-terminal cleavage/methylation domain-containing protein